MRYVGEVIDESWREAFQEWVGSESIGKMSDEVLKMFEGYVQKQCQKGSHSL